MEKLTMQSHNVIGSNTRKIAQLFPNCVTERKGKDGKPELAIDFEKLQAELSNEIIDVKEESDIDSFLGGATGSLFTEEIKGLDDFELICFLVIK